MHQIPKGTPHTHTKIKVQYTNAYVVKTLKKGNNPQQRPTRPLEAIKK